MRAVRFSEYGGLDAISCDEIAEPVPKKGEVLVRVYAAGVNAFDWYATEGWANECVRFNLPAVLGRDLSGVVAGLGEGVANFGIGDAVYGHVDAAADGSFADYVVVPAYRVARKPARLVHVQAASLPTVMMGAWDGLFSSGAGAHLEPGQVVLVHGAAGGIGSIAVQLAKQKGARVLGTASLHNHTFLKALGVDRIFDYAAVGWNIGLEPVDVVLDTSNGAAAWDLCSLIRKNGRYVTTRRLPGPPFVSEQSLRGVSCFAANGTARPDAFQQMAELVGTGAIKPVVTAVYTLSQFRSALDVVRRGHVRGKIVMQIRR